MPFFNKQFTCSNSILVGKVGQLGGQEPSDMCNHLNVYLKKPTSLGFLLVSIIKNLKQSHGL